MRGKKLMLLARKSDGISPVYDNFARSDGDLGGDWVYSTGVWTIDTSNALATPGLGVEKNTIAGATTDPNGNEADANGNFAGASMTLSRVTGGEQHTGTYALLGTTSSDGAARKLYYATSALANSITRTSVYAKKGALTASTGNVAFNSTAGYYQKEITTSWASHLFTGISVAAYDLRLIFNASVTGDEVYVDNLSIKTVNTADVFAVKDMKTSNVEVSASLTVEDYMQAGVALCLDSTTNPQNFMICYLTKYATIQKMILVKVVSGVYGIVLSEEVTYSPGDSISVTKSGTDVSCYLNDVQVGSTQTVSDETIVNNTIHGMFSTDANNLFHEVAINP
jgi:hypothetical protein